RRVVLGSLLGIAGANLISAFAPNVATLTAAQTVTRGFSIAAIVAAGIAAVEEAPEGGRAYATSILTLTGGAGLTLAIVLLPLSDRLSWAWRLLFLLSAAAALLNSRIATHFVESERYQRVVASKIARGRVRHVFGA